MATATILNASKCLGPSQRAIGRGRYTSGAASKKNIIYNFKKLLTLGNWIESQLFVTFVNLLACLNAGYRCKVEQLGQAVV